MNQCAGGGDDPRVQLHRTADATGSTFTNALHVSVCVCSPAHDKALFPESHASPLLFFLSAEFKEGPVRTKEA